MKLTTALALIGILCGAIFTTETIGAPGSIAPLLIDTNAVLPRLWQPVPDTLFLQEIGSKILTEQPITTVAVHGGTAYAVVSGKLKSVSQGWPMILSALKTLLETGELAGVPVPE